MGIDVYMHWSGQAERDVDTGYLRESYSGEHYATHVLVPEAFADGWDERGAPIPASTLVDRTEDALAEVHKRYAGDPERIEAASKRIADFVELAKRKERETGEPVRIYASW
jgi:hypothetical protein